MAEVKLPFDLNPELNTYHNLAHPLGILGGNIPDKSVWFPWLCNKYINCYYTEKPQKGFSLYSVDRFFTGDLLMERIEVTILPERYLRVLRVTETAFIDFVKTTIASGAYIHGMNNERYISVMAPYQKYDYAHDYLLFGFSDEAMCFYAAGYTADDKYQEYKLPYHEYYASIFQPFYNALSFRIVRFTGKDIFYKTNYRVVTRDLKHYLNSTAFKSNIEDEKIYGLSAWHKLSEYLANTDKIDLRFTKIFMEHHKLMHMRIDCLSKQGIIQDKLGEQYVQAKEQANQAYLLSMKYNLTQRQSTKNSCLALVENAIELDKVILPDVISQIEKNTNAE